MMRRMLVTLAIGTMIFAAASYAEEITATLEAKVVERPKQAGQPEAAKSATSAISHVTCHKGQLQRHVELKSGMPSEVHYRKESEAPGSDQLLFAGSHSYCAARAAEFVAKLKSWGWQCSELAS